MSTLTVYRLGRVEYEDGLQLMELFGEARRQGLCEDVLLLLEHPPVLTLGRAAKRANIVASDAQLSSEGVEIASRPTAAATSPTTAPGSSSATPSSSCPEDRQDVRRYVRDVEQLHDPHRSPTTASPPAPSPSGRGCGSARRPAPRRRGRSPPSACTSPAGSPVTASRSTSTRTCAHFGLIVPCGIREAGVTSLQQELGRAVPVAEVEDKVARHFAEVFELELAEPKPLTRTVSVAVMRGHGPEARVLLLRRRPERGGFWQIVTGRVEPGEQPRRPPRGSSSRRRGCAPTWWTWSTATPSRSASVVPPRLVEENAFAARCSDNFEIRLGDEHDAHEWVDVPTALARLPFRGLREGVQRALRRSRCDRGGDPHPHSLSHRERAEWGRGLELQGVPLHGGDHLGTVLAHLLHEAIHRIVVARRLVVEEHQRLHLRLVGRLAPRASQVEWPQPTFEAPTRPSYSSSVYIAS